MSNRGYSSTKVRPSLTGDVENDCNGEFSGSKRKKEKEQLCSSAPENHVNCLFWINDAFTNSAKALQSSFDNATIPVISRDAL
ncbi:hypothetical protein HZH68_002596 [Vespula germanica]|uniref:Uncharacterized protein n=1 Tax=Vespula germanica TaxID=30212 RepID=A0A834NML7_VESGE|nr:hypothetical protein HZH68_002596 [Vespula germanica]